MVDILGRHARQSYLDVLEMTVGEREYLLNITVERLKKEQEEAEKAQRHKRG